MVVILIVALIVTGGAGVSVAAENALPGDALYGIKVGVNENVRAALSFSSEAKARWEGRRAERRLEEAEKLAAEGSASADVLARLQSNFEAHAERVESRIAEFESRENFAAAADVAANFQTSLRAHESILARLSNETEANLGSLLASVRARASAVASAMSRANANITAGVSVDVKDAAEGMLGAAENKIAEVKAFINRMESRVSAEASAEARAKLSAAESALAQGNARFGAEAYAEAFTLYQQALQTAQEAKLLLESRLNLEIRIGTGADVEVETGPPDSAGEAGADVRANGGVEAEGEVQVEVGL